MIKKLTIGAALVSAFVLTGCGGGGSSSSSSAPKYETLQDLEYKTLTLEEYWHTIQDDTKNKTHTTMVFKETYTDSGYLIDERSNSKVMLISNICVIQLFSKQIPQLLNLQLCMFLI